TSRTSAAVSPISAIRPTGSLVACGFRQTERERPHPSGAGARLACAASAEEQPDAPVLLLDPEGELRWARVEFPRLKHMREFAIDRRLDFRNEFVRRTRAPRQDRCEVGLLRPFRMIEDAAQLPSVFLTEVEEGGALDAKHRRDLVDGNGAGVVDEPCLLDEFRRQDDLAESHAGILFGKTLAWWAVRPAHLWSVRFLYRT